MQKPIFNESLFFVGRDALFASGLSSALPSLRLLVDFPGCESAIDVLKRSDVQAQIPRGANLLVFKPAPKIEFLAEQHGWHLAEPTSALNRRFENKLEIVEIFSRLGLPMIASQILEPKKTSWEELTARFGSKIVAQTERGHAGSSSHLLECAKDFEALEAECLTKFATFVEGETWTVNAVATRFGTLSSRPFFQLQGPEVCGVLDVLGTCGNQHRPIEDILAQEIMNYTKRFGDAMYAEGYRGWFGLDVLVVDGSIAGFIECNPRLTASVGVFTEMQVEALETPFIVLHVLETLGREYAFDIESEQANLLKGFSEAHLFLYHPKESTTSVIQTWKPGIYTHEGNFLREGGAWSELKEGEVLLRARPVGVTITPGMSYAMAITRGEIPRFDRFRLGK